MARRRDASISADAWFDASALRVDDPVVADSPSDAETPSELPRVAADDAAVARRARVRAFFLAIVAIQLVVPLTYYIREDPYDERFAWRMFSGIRVQRCETRAFETSEGVERELALGQLVHVAWVTHLRRNRRDVVEGLLSRRCREREVTHARVANTCRAADDDSLWLSSYARECASGVTTLSRERRR